MTAAIRTWPAAVEIQGQASAQALSCLISGWIAGPEASGKPGL